MESESTCWRHRSQIIDLKTSVTGKSIDHYNDLSARRLVASPVSHIDLLVTVSSKLPSGSTTLILVHTMEEGGFPSLGKKCRDPKMIGMWKMGREIGRGAYGLVKRAREMREDGTLGVRVLIS